MRYFSTIFYSIVVLSSSLALNAQTRIKLFGKIKYSVDYPEYQQHKFNFKHAVWSNPYYNIYIYSPYYFEKGIVENSHRGKVLITATDGVQVEGYCDPAYAPSRIPWHIDLVFPAIKSIHKVEVFDKNNNLIFEDTFESQSLNVTIEQIDKSTFQTNPNSIVYVSDSNFDGCNFPKTYDRKTGIFSTIMEHSSTGRPYNQNNISIVSIAHNPHNSFERGFAVWSSNSEELILEFADAEISSLNPQPISNTSSKKTSSTASSAKTNIKNKHP